MDAKIRWRNKDGVTNCILELHTSFIQTLYLMRIPSWSDCCRHYSNCHVKRLFVALTMRYPNISLRRYHTHPLCLQAQYLFLPEFIRKSENERWPIRWRLPAERDLIMVVNLNAYIEAAIRKWSKLRIGDAHARARARAHTHTHTHTGWAILIHPRK